MSPDKAGPLDGRTLLDNDARSSPQRPLRSSVLSIPPPPIFKYLAQNAFLVVIDLSRHIVPVVQVSLSVSGIFRDHALKSNLHQYEEKAKKYYSEY